jgi:hypothetical protein
MLAAIDNLKLLPSYSVRLGPVAVVLPGKRTQWNPGSRVSRQSTIKQVAYTSIHSLQDLRIFYYPLDFFQDRFGNFHLFPDHRIVLVVGVVGIA